MLVLHRRPGAVTQERREHDHDEDGLDPPRVAALRIAPAAWQNLDGYRLHFVSSERLERFERFERSERLERFIAPARSRPPPGRTHPPRSDSGEPRRCR